MRRRESIAGAVVGCILAGTLLAPARGDDPIGRLSLSLNFGATTLAMNDVNREIARGNEYLSFEGLTTIDDLSYGFNFYGDFKTAIKDPFFISLGGGSLSGTTEEKFNQIISITSESTFYYGRLFYALPWRPLEDSRLFVGAGPVFLRDVTLDVTHERDYIAKQPERTEQLSLTGSGSGFQLDAVFEYLISDHLTLNLTAGYRRATADWDDYEITVTNIDEEISTQDDWDDDEQIFWEVETYEAYLLNAFLKEVPFNEELQGPPLQELEVVDNLDLDFSGARLEVGLRLHFF
ncbi:MAG: hypothetical protein GF355_15550 [Candidatus Eisenbacteria bacterium]|nr:hypothetical protein [Candidatus Eisenbacteria bacterium]